MTGLAIGLVIGVLVVLFLVVVARRVIRIAREYERIVLFRLGREIGARGPGLVFLNPVTDRTTLVDLREQYLEIPHQTAITADNAAISIDFIMFYKVLDPVASVVEVRNFSGAALNVAATTLRSVVGEMPLDDVLSKREAMNIALRTKLDEITERWGVKVTNVEVREINPPPAVQDAMTRQMSAERSRRAAVTESEGQKQAAITVAEGQKQAMVLAAEAEKQATILAAEGEREASVTKAKGLADALATLDGTAGRIDKTTVLLRYLDVLQSLSGSESSKILLPMELTGLIGQVSQFAQLRDRTSTQSNGHTARTEH
ncbi:MAG: SPFH domain-containing protein [Acidimicrobiales bacterium]